MSTPLSIPAVSVTYAQDGTSTKPNALGMRSMQERAYQKRGEQYLLIKSPPASGKSRALMFIALDKLENQGLKQAIIVVPEKSIGSSFHNEPLSQFGFWADWQVEPKWNLCDAPGGDSGGKVAAVKKFLASAAKVLVCTHATFRFAVDKFGIEVFDDRLIAVDEFHHVSANPDNKLGDHICQLMTQGKNHLVATFKLANINRKKLKALLHKIFDSARLELALPDRFGIPVQPREWFLVPLEVIEEVIEKIKGGTIDRFQYDPKTASLIERLSCST